MMYFFEYLDEVGAAVKATGTAHILHGAPVFQKDTRMGDSYAVQIVEIGGSGQGPEQTSKVVFAVAKHGGNIIEPDLFCIVFLGPGYQFLHPSIVQIGFWQGTP